MPTFDVVVVGEINPDLIVRGNVVPAFGQVEQNVDEAALVIGASSAIFACGAARLGMRVAFIGTVGDDVFGQFMLRQLEGRGVDTRGVVVDKNLRTGVSIILSRGDDRAILTYPGSIAALRYEQIDFDLVGEARHLHLGGYFMLEALRPHVPQLFSEARARGLTISLDTNYDPSEQWGAGLNEAIAAADIFLPNQAELCAIARTSDMEAGLVQLARHVPTVAVKRGAAGAMAHRGEEFAHAGALPVELVDTTGAGDSFDAGFVYGFLQGWDLPRTLRVACACGSLSTRAAGGTAAQPTLVEALAAIEL